MIKVRITGSVQNANGPVVGIVEMPDHEAERLIKIGVAQIVDQTGKISGANVNGDNFKALEDARLGMDQQSKTILSQSEVIENAKQAIAELTKQNKECSAEYGKLSEKLQSVETELATSRKEIETLKSKKKSS